MRTTFQLLLRRPSFLRLWAADFVSQIGDWFSLVAVSVVSLQSPGGGVMALATSLAAHLLPQSFASPLGGFLADRYDKRRVLRIGAAVEGALTLLMLVAAGRSDVLALQVLLCMRSIASAAREPAIGAALPRLVEREELADANAFGAFTWSIAFALGMSLGGVATTLGPEIALGVDAATFFVAWTVLRRIPALAPLGSTERAERLGAFADSFDVLKRALRPSMRGSVFGLSPMAFAAGSAWLSLNLAGQALPSFVGAATTVGFLQAVRGGGTALGPLATRWMARAPEGERDLGRVASAAVLIGTLGLAWAPSLWVATLASILWGAGGGALWMIMTTEIQQRSDDRVRGRMIALSGLGFTATMSAGAMAAAGLLAAGFSSLQAAAPLVTVSGLGFLWLRRRPVRGLGLLRVEVAG